MAHSVERRNDWQGQWRQSRPERMERKAGGSLSTSPQWTRAEGRAHGKWAHWSGADCRPGISIVFCMFAISIGRQAALHHLAPKGTFLSHGPGSRVVAAECVLNGNSQGADHPGQSSAQPLAHCGHPRPAGLGEIWRHPRTHRRSRRGLSWIRVWWAWGEGAFGSWCCCVSGVRGGSRWLRPHNSGIAPYREGWGQ